MPLIESAPIVVPWYAVRRATAFQRRSPRAWWYWRASFHADSTASEPPETKKTAVEIARRERRHLLRKLDRARMRVRPVRVERQLAHLLERGLPHLLAVRVADLHREEPGERVEVALALAVLEVAPLAAHDDRRLVAGHAREVEPEMVACGLLQLFGAHARRRCAHARVPQS